jgi:hypothetical protein
MAQTLQYKTTAQRARIQTSSAGIHHPVAGKANHELTFKPDQLGGADQIQPQQLIPLSHETKLNVSLMSDISYVTNDKEVTVTWSQASLF